MEYLKGPTLATYLRHLHQRKKRIPPHQVARLLKGLTAALDYAHGQGVIHRDVKPANILLHNNTDEIPLDKPLTNDVVAVITDFGLVRIMNAATQTASGFISGTPAYMSPEQARGDQIDHRTDIYSLGVVLYEMLAGRVPFDADSTLTVLHMQIHTTPSPIPGIAPEVQAVLDRALLKNPNDRYQTSIEMAIDFYLSIGMNRQAETIREPSPVKAEPIESPAPPMPEPTQKEEPPPKPEPVIKSEPDAKPATKPKIEPVVKPQQKSEPTPQPARNRRGILPILLSVIGLAVLAVAGYLFFSRGPSVPTATATLSIVTPDNTIVPSPSEPSNLPESTRMVPIAAGTYQVGKNPADAYHSAPQSISLNEYWIDQYQVTNQEFQQYLAEWSFTSGLENYPVIGVTWEQADAYCNSQGKRLPSEAEWEAAGRGSGENPPIYPWGEDATLALGLPNHFYEVGTLSFNRSPFDIYDMIGNVYEWVGEPYYGSVAAGNKLLRGVRASVPENLTFRVEVGPEETNYSQYAGFRCAADQVK